MKIEFEGRAWLLEMDEVTVRQGEKIAVHTGGLSIMAWYRSILEMEAAGWLKSMQCLYWLMHEQNSETVPMDSDFAPLKLLSAFDAAAGAEQQETGDAAAEAEADPTRPAGGLAGESPAGVRPEGSPAG